MKMICPLHKTCSHKTLDSGVSMVHCFPHEERDSCYGTCTIKLMKIHGSKCIPYDLKHIMKEVLKKDKK